MQRIAFISVKGGTGKSLLSSLSIIHLSKYYKVVGLGCDTDNPCLAFYLGLSSPKKAVKLGWILKMSSRTKIEDSVCPFGAIKNGRIIEPLCKGCGVCLYKEPGKVVVSRIHAGVAYIYEHEMFTVIEGELLPGRSGAGIIVEELKSISNRIEKDVEIRDCPAGYGCSFISSVKDADILIAIAEPTVPGLNALLKCVDIAELFGKELFVVINKKREYSTNILQGLKIIGTVPYIRDFVRILRRPGGSWTIYEKYYSSIKEVLNNIRDLI